MVHFITYSNELYKPTRDFCVMMAKIFGGFDSITSYSPEDIDADFYQNNKKILDIKAGNGLWLWKPYFVVKKLLEVNDGDIVFYQDAGSFFFRSCKKIIGSMNDDDVWVSTLPLIEKQFTKPELFQKMGCDGDQYKDSCQIQANFLAIRKTERGIQFAQEWLFWCTNEGCLSRETEVDFTKECYTYMGHRSDQSVLSLLSKKWGLPTHRDPSQYGRIPEKYFAPGRLFCVTPNNDDYKCCIILHRGRCVNIKTIASQLGCVFLPLRIIHKFSKPCKMIKEINR